MYDAYLPHAAEMLSWVLQMGKEYRLKKNNNLLLVKDFCTLNVFDLKPLKILLLVNPCSLRSIGGLFE